MWTTTALERPSKVWLVRDKRKKPRWPAETDRESLWRAIDGLLEADRVSRGLTADILRVEKKLQRRVNADAWELYLSVEQLRNARTARWLLAVALWAHAEARRRRRH